MGTNYYLIVKAGECECCGRGDTEEWHIGKSSAGWRYLLRTHPGEFDRLEDYLRFIFNLERSEKEFHIRDEYGRNVSLVRWLSVVFDRGDTSDTDGYPDSELSPSDYYRVSSAEFT